MADQVNLICCGTMIHCARQIPNDESPPDRRWTLNLDHRLHGFERARLERQLVAAKDAYTDGRQVARSSTRKNHHEP
jgi:hypothetical protein